MDGKHLRDSAALVPEIAECAAAVIHEDATLIAAEIDIAWVSSVTKDERNSHLGPDWLEWVEGKRQRALERVANTAAKTPRGEAIKARYAVREALS